MSRQVYSPNSSPNPNAYYEGKSLLQNQDGWTEIDDTTLPQTASHSRLCKRVVICVIVSVLFGALAPLLFHLAPQTAKDAIKSHLPSHVYPGHFPGSQQNSTSLIPISDENRTKAQSVGIEDYDDNEPVLDEEGSDEQDLKQTADVRYISTRTPLPSLRQPAHDEKFISYLPHSGYHNQRIELQNALLLGTLLNRTVLVPHVRVGRPISWRAKTALQATWKLTQKTQSKINECVIWIAHLENKERLPSSAARCQDYLYFSEWSWSFLVNLNKAGITVPLVARPDLSYEWLTSKDGLKIPEESILRIDDNVQYDYKYYVSEDVETANTLDNYARRYNLQDLLTEQAQSKRLIEFGSLYGSYRINLDNADLAWSRISTKIKEAMVWDMPLLEKVADEMRAQLGGTQNYMALHLRVGDGAFAAQAQDHMTETLIKVLRLAFALPAASGQRIIEKVKALPDLKVPIKKSSIIAQHRSWNWMEEAEDDNIGGEDAVAELNPESIYTKQSSRQVSMQCTGRLHTDPELMLFNKAHVYIATDSHSPRRDPTLALFFQLFPCAHTLDDFSHLTPLQNLLGYRSSEEGIKLAPFLIPMLEAVMAGSSVRVIGTTGSTFSRFVTSTLYDHYWPDFKGRKAAQLSWRASLVT